MIKLILAQTKKNKPYFSLMLILSCCVATIPQFFLDNNYSYLTGQAAKLDRFYLVALNAFTHSPEILINHFIGNLLVILVFGVLAESIIGSKRFALISVVSFATTTCVNYLHSTSGTSHGVSGVIWGYHLFFIILLVAYYKEKGRAAFKDPFVIFAIFLFAFDIVGIMLLEVLVLHLRLFGNFGQVLHIVSLAITIPFMLLWKNDLSTNIKQYLQSSPIEFAKPKCGIGTVLFFILIAINLFGVIKAFNS